MKRLLKNISLLLLFLLIIKGVKGQYKIDNRTTQKINLKALNLVEKYAFRYNMKKGREYDNFMDLFVENNAELFNDIMPDNNLNTIISKDAYIRLFLDYYNKPLDVEIDPFEISPIRDFNNGKGNLSVFTKKIMSGITKEGINYIDTFYIDIKIEFDISKSFYRIKSVKSINLLGQYCVIEAHTKRLFRESKIINNDTLLINNNKIEVDDLGHYILKNINDTISYKIESPNDDIIGIITINKKTINNYKRSKIKDKNIRIIEFKYPYFFIEPFVSFNPFKLSPVKYSGDNFEFSLENNFSYNTGINMGILIFPKYRIFIKTGFQYKKIYYTTNLEQYIYQTNQIDSDNYPYIRTNNINSISEETELSYYVIPVGIFKIFKFKHFNINAELGAQYHNNINSTYSTSAKSLYSGFYKDLYGITISENGVYDFGNYELENSDNLNSLTDFFTLYSSIGIGHYINKRTSINIDLLYNHGFNNIFNEDKKGLSNKKEVINSLTNISNNFVLREIYINLNLKYKF